MTSTISGDDNFDSAGPFGITKLASGNFSNDAYFQYNFNTSYTNFILVWNGVQTGTTSGSLNFRLTDSSGTLITSAEYNADYTLAETLSTLSSQNNGHTSGIMWIIGALDSGSRTAMLTQTANSRENYVQGNDQQFIMEFREVNNGIRMYGPANFTDGQYQVYGVQ